MPQVPTQDFAEKANKTRQRRGSKAARTCKGETRSSLSLSPADPPDPKLCPGAKLGINAPLLWEERGNGTETRKQSQITYPLPLPSVTERRRGGIAWYRNPRASDHLGRTPACTLRNSSARSSIARLAPVRSDAQGQPASQPASQSVSQCAQVRPFACAA